MEKLNKLKAMFPNASCELIYHNHFELLIAVSLSAQTTDKRVNVVTSTLFKKYPTPVLLANANYEDVYNIIVSLGLAKQKTKNIISLSQKLINDFNGIIPNTLEQLVSFPGVGRKTANVILMEGFSIPRIPVDTHVLRVANRLNLVDTTDVLQVEKQLEQLYPINEWYYVHHTFLFFGRYFCYAKNPKCNECPFKGECKYCNLK